MLGIDGGVTAFVRGKERDDVAGGGQIRISFPIQKLKSSSETAGLEYSCANHVKYV